MSELLASRSQGKKLINNVLEIASEARKSKQANPSIINATAGMLLNDESKLCAFSSVASILEKQEVSDKFAYATTEASAKFKDNILMMLFKKHYKEITEKMHCEVIPTPGGSGALSNTIHNYLNPGETLLIPDVGWGPYKLMAREYVVEAKTFNYIKDEKFDREAFRKSLKVVAEKQKRIVFIINDPCHNPTGFSLDYSDYEFIIAEMNRYAETGLPVVMIFDLAYLDFSIKDYQIKRDIFLLFTRLHNNAAVIACWSASKTFSLYGMRLGAQIFLGREKASSVTFLDANLFSARTKWSNITQSGFTFIESFDKDVINNFNIELETARLRLFGLGSKLYQELLKTGYPIYPFKEGFFVMIKIAEPETAFHKLKAAGIYTIPFPSGVRFSASSISALEIEGLAVRIKEVLGG
ncbi:MAG: aminotransferase class I/II-fold pyridoxal phosphate-dependent enzyme [Erysipelotrichales bacterium]|nr:aminotransferase class I/II-fold pyridoxal phosphate-dependent enzyme [Erysipelotrichales bacterium]